jgi:hypothetical protein
MKETRGPGNGLAIGKAMTSSGIHRHETEESPRTRIRHQADRRWRTLQVASRLLLRHELLERKINVK